MSNVKAEIHYVNSSGEVLELNKTETEVAFFTKTRTEQDKSKIFQCHFTDEFYYFLWDSLGLLKVRYEEEISELGKRIGEHSSDEKLTERLSQKINLLNEKKGKLSTLVENFFEWIEKKKIHSFIEESEGVEYNSLDTNNFVKLFWEEKSMPVQGNTDDIIFINLV